MRGNAHVRFGGRAGETHITRVAQGAPVRPYSTDGIDFAGLDDIPVRIVALFASPLKHQKQHMKLLAALSRLLQTASVRDRLIGATEAAEVIEVFSHTPQPV